MKSVSNIVSVKKCKKWKHDFNFSGKKSCHQIKCKICGIKLVKWTEDMCKEYDERYK